MDYRSRAQTALRDAYGDSATFRDGQEEAILAVAEARGRVLLVQRTGWGKSIVYFVATRLLRDDGRGPTIIVSPLLALMRDQINAASRLGLRAVTINSSNRDDWEAISADVKLGAIDLLLVSPERFNNQDFRDDLLPFLLQNAGLLVIDEAHCISDWGHDFRPDYRRLSSLIRLLPPGVPVLATTATANDRVVHDICTQMGESLTVLRGTLERTSLELHAIRLPTKAQRLAWLAAQVERLPGTGIIYTLTVGDAELVASWLVSRGIKAVPYSGDAEADLRIQIEDDLLANRVKAVCSTSALGMGFDKPDLGFVIHYQSPSSVVAYYQQVGRAGRALDTAVGVLLAGVEDEDIWEYFLRTSLPLQEDADSVVEDLQQHGDWMSLTDLEESVNLSRGRLTGLLKILEVEGALERQGSRYRRSLSAWTFDRERVERVRQQRLEEQAVMKAYPDSRECRMAFIRTQLDDASSLQCGRCDNCTTRSLEISIDPLVAAEAVRFIRGRDFTIDPRLRWPGHPKSGAISRDLQVEPGRALCRLSDGGWGDVVLQYKHAQAAFPPELVDAFADMIRHWGPRPSPEWIAFIPSADPERQMVPILASDLGNRLGLRAYPALTKGRRTQAQKLMENSQQQLANIYGAFAINGAVPQAPLLLIDDIADSRWTLTYVGSLLRAAGSGPVFPATLARSRG